MGNHAQGGGVGGDLGGRGAEQSGPALRLGAVERDGPRGGGDHLPRRPGRRSYGCSIVFDLADRGAVHVTPFLDLVLTWNTGISYGLFPQEGLFGQWALLAFKVAAVVLLWVWLARAASRLTGAGARADHRRGARQRHRPRWPTGRWPISCCFTSKPQTFSFNWYVFNLADVAIVAGVVGLLYEFAAGDRAAKAP